MVEVFFSDMDPFNPKEGEPAFGGMDDLQSDLLASPDLTRLLEKVNEGTDMVAADDRKLKKAERDRVRVRYHNDPDLKYPDSPASRQKRMHNSGVAFAQDIKRGSERFLAHHQQVFDQTQSPLVRSAKWLEEARTAFDDAQVAEREAGDRWPVNGYDGGPAEPAAGFFIILLNDAAFVIKLPQSHIGAKVFHQGRFLVKGKGLFD